MKTKEEVIKEAWGVHYSSDIDENGYRTYNDFQAIHLNQWFGDFWEKGFNEVLNIHWVRPKILKGIENNNGWIKIKSEDDLPEYGYYEVIRRDTGEYLRASLDNKISTTSLIQYYSHYKPIENIDLPLH